MKIRLFNIKDLLILFILLVIFEGCYKKDKLVGEYYLTDEMKQTVPFDGSETIYFIDIEDTITLNQGRRNNYINTIYISQTEYTYGEHDDTEFKTENGKYFIYLDLLRNYYNNPGNIKIIWYEHDNNISISEGRFFFKLPLSTATLESGQWFLDEMYVHDVKYSNVYCDSVPYYDGYTWPNEPKTVYYTEEAGIIKIDFTQGNSWELLKIDWD